MTVSMIVLALLTIIASFGVIGCTRPLNSALCLVLTLFLIAGHYALLDAHFVAAIQILVYAGAIMVLVIFVIMLLGIEKDESGLHYRKFQNLIATAIIGVFIAMLVVSFSDGLVSKPLSGQSASALVGEFGNSKAVGQVLYTEYYVPLQVTGMLLLAAIIGAVVLAHEKRRPLSKGRGLQAMRDKFAEEE